jgi:hypothetical protein
MEWELIEPLLSHGLSGMHGVLMTALNGIFYVCGLDVCGVACRNVMGGVSLSVITAIIVGQSAASGKASLTGSPKNPDTVCT